jgi:hypothetical protein
LICTRAISGKANINLQKCSVSDFQIVKTNFQKFTLVTSLSFSVYSPFEIEFFTNNDDDLDYYKWNGGYQKWLSFTILLQNNSVFYLKNDKVMRHVSDFKPYEIVVKTKNATFWKLHDCKYLNPFFLFTLGIRRIVMTRRI